MLNSVSDKYRIWLGPAAVQHGNLRLTRKRWIDLEDSVVLLWLCDLGDSESESLVQVLQLQVQMRHLPKKINYKAVLMLAICNYMQGVFSHCWCWGWQNPKTKKVNIKTSHLSLFCLEFCHAQHLELFGAGPVKKYTLHLDIQMHWLLYQVDQ